MEQIQIRNAAGEVVEISEGRVHARGRSDFEAALLAGRAFSWANATYDYDALDTILGIANDSDDYDLHVERIICTGDTATEVVVHTSPGVVMAGTIVQGVNLNRGSALVPPATARADETGNGQQAAGYTGRIVTGRFAANGLLEFGLGGGLILPRDWNVGVDYTADGGAANVVVWGYFKARA